MALPKEDRIKRFADFQHVFREGKTIRGTFLFFKFLCRQGGRARFGVVVSSKVAPKAVERNRIRRIILSEIATALKSIHGRDVVVVVQKMPTEPQRLVDETRNLLRKLTSGI